MVSLYQIYHPSSNKTYIGQTSNSIRSRLRDHIWKATHKANTFRDYWIRSLLKRGLRPNIRLLMVVPDNEADFSEIFLIALFKELKIELTNISPGGSVVRGSDHWAFGKKLSKLHIQRISNALKGKPSKLRGVPLSEDHKQKISKATSGKIFSEETKEKISKAKMGHPGSHKGIPRTEEVKRKIGYANLKASKEIRLEIQNKFISGTKQYILVKEYGLSKPTILKILREAGLK